MKKKKAEFLDKHPRLKTAVTAGEGVSKARAWAARMLVFLAVHVGMSVPAAALAVAGASIPVAYVAGKAVGGNRCDLIERPK